MQTMRIRARRRVGEGLGNERAAEKVKIRGGMNPLPINIFLNKSHANWNDWMEPDSSATRSAGFIVKRTAPGEIKKRI